jgi:hypothetical protein
MTYDPSVGIWLEEDPAGFAAGDTNLQKRCRLNQVDL